MDQPRYAPLEPRSTPKQAWVTGLLLVTWLAPWAQAAQLRPVTLAAFEQYVRAAEVRMAAGATNGHFLSIDRLSPAERERAYQELARGEIYVAPAETQKESQPLRVPSGLIHHWTGAVFIPGATFSEIAGLVQNYDNEENVYRPEVQKSRLMEQNGGVSKVYLQFYYKSLSTAVLNAFFDNQFTRISDTQGELESCSTGVREVRNASRPDQIELPDGQGSGYLWRLDSYWRIEQKDGGVYLEIETIGMSRTVPSLLAPLVEPLVRSIPRKVLTDLLNDTREAATIESRNAAAGRATSAAATQPAAKPPNSHFPITAQSFLGRAAR